ncbi:MAG: nicotinate-nucleotide adenylyltransferase [Dehalococcoidales bacterium]|nr:nicotinate-nucleotide adenylyltransferase [Dehalococcoidales bacterium]
MGVVKAILGGTFDPIHNGHLKIAEYVQKELKVDEIIFMPAGTPYFKIMKPVTAASKRKKMVSLAIKGKPGMSVSSIEIRRKGLTYTIDTIREIRQGMKKNDQLYFILGWDNLISFPYWRDPEEILKLCKLVAIPRTGYAIPEKKELDALIPGFSKRVILLDQPIIDVSSSEIRKRVQEGRPISDLVPEAVEAFILDKGLYLHA